MGNAYRFESQIDRIDQGISFHVLPVPPDIAAKVGNARRILLTLGNQTHRRALQGVKSGSPFITVSLQILKPLGLRYGSYVYASIAADPKPDALHIAEELTEALSQDTEAKKCRGTIAHRRQPKRRFGSNSRALLRRAGIEIRCLFS